MRSRIYAVSVQRDTRKIFIQIYNPFSNIDVTSNEISVLTYNVPVLCTCVLVKALHTNNINCFIHSLTKRLCVCVCLCAHIFTINVIGNMY